MKEKMKSSSAGEEYSEGRFDRTARLLLLGALLFLILNVAVLAYRFRLPTEGWAINTDESYQGVSEFIVISNVAGAPSPLQPGDILRVIGGYTSAQIQRNMRGPIPPPGWKAGGQVTVTVIRHAVALTFDIPIVHWTLAAWLRSNLGDLGSLTSWLSALIMLGVGLFTFLKRPGNLAGRFLFFFGLANFMIVIADSLPDSLGIYFDFFALFGRALFGNIIFAYLFAPSILGFALTFPRPKNFIRQKPWLLVLPFLLGSVTIVILFIAPDQAAVGFPLTLFMVLGAIIALVHSGLTMHDAISRAQLRWAVGGVVFGLGLFTINFLPLNVPGFFQYLLPSVASLSVTVMGISLAIAILRYRLFDIDLIIRRTLVYALLSAMLGLVYYSGVVVLQSLLTANRGQQAGGSSAASGSSSAVVIVLTTLLIAGLFNPLRLRLQDLIDRRFYRQKYDAERALAEFAAAASRETELQTLTARLVGVVQQTVQPEKIALWMNRKQQ